MPKLTSLLLVLVLLPVLSGCASTAVNNDPSKLKQVQLRKSEAGGWWAALTGSTAVCTLQTIGLSEATIKALLPQLEAYCKE